MDTEHLECPCCGEPDAIPATVKWCTVHQREPYPDDGDEDECAKCVIALAAWQVDTDATCPACGCKLTVAEGMIDDTVMPWILESCEDDDGH
jgi:hypothetical protein